MMSGFMRLCHSVFRGLARIIHGHAATRTRLCVEVGGPLREAFFAGCGQTAPLPPLARPGFGRLYEEGAKATDGEAGGAAGERQAMARVETAW